jgi:hypothetical protein
MLLVIFHVSHILFYERFEGTTSHISKNDIQYNGQKKKHKQSTKHTENTKDRVTRTPLNLVLAVPASQVTPVGLLFLLAASTGQSLNIG